MVGSSGSVNSSGHWQTWHSWGSAVDLSYEALDSLARRPESLPAGHGAGVDEPALLSRPPGEAVPASLAAQDVWLAHPWVLGEPPAGATVVAVVITDAHRQHPWSPVRWAWVTARQAALSSIRWVGSAAEIAAALAGVARVRTQANPHIDAWLPPGVERLPEPRHFKAVAPVCGSFSRWWDRVQRAR